MTPASNAFDPKLAFPTVAAGDPAAADFCLVFQAWVHTLDDLVDQDKPVALEALGLVMLRFMETMGQNPFWLKNQGYLMPLVRSGFLSWLSSEVMRKSQDVRDQMAAEVLKSTFQEVYFGVAFLTGGYDHMLECNRRFRSYCWG